MNAKNITNFIFELNQLKKQAQTGWNFVGVKHPDTVAEHSLRAAQIAYILAMMEGDVNAEKVACMLMVHDNAETRIGDQNKVGAKYFSKKEAEENAFSDQLDLLGEEIKKRWKSYFDEFENRNTKEGIVAKDADWLEVAFGAKELLDLGHEAAIDWINNIERALETESAKRLIKEMKDTKFTDWWRDLKKMTYEKLK